MSNSREEWTKVIQQQQTAKAHKYSAKPKMVDGIRFASTKEANRYIELKHLERAKKIRGLRLQPRFDIEIKGTKICTYVADFQYDTVPWDYEEVTTVVEDVKGLKTPIYKLKRKMVEACFGIQITEV